MHAGATRVAHAYTGGSCANMHGSRGTCVSRAWQVGCKLRVAAASLKGAAGPCGALEQPQGFLDLCYNAASPAAWDAPLGAAYPPCVLRPLELIARGGGSVPGTLLLVQSRWGATGARWLAVGCSSVSVWGWGSLSQRLRCLY